MKPSCVFLEKIWVIFCIFWVSCQSFWSSSLSTDFQKNPSTDVQAILVLGGGPGRIQAAGEIWYAYWKKYGRLYTPFIYCAGLGEKFSWKDFIQQLPKETATYINKEQVILEKKSYNTQSNAQYFASYVKATNWKKIILVTSSYHMPRALFIFKKILDKNNIKIDIQYYVASEKSFEHTWKNYSRKCKLLIIEILKTIYYIGKYTFFSV